MKRVLTILLVAFLGGCAFSKQGSDANDRELRERNLLQKDFDIVTGVYEGELNTGAQVQKVSLTVFTLDEKDTTPNPDGSERFRPRLKAALQRIEPAQATLPMDARFVADTGDLFLTNPSKAIGVDEIHTITASLHGKTITGEVKTPAGPIGNLSLVFKSKNPTLADPSEENRQNERIRETLSKVVGDYSGVAVPPETVSPPYRVVIRLYIAEIVKDGKTNLALKGFFYHYEAGDVIANLQMDANYRPDLSPAKLTMVTSSLGNYSVTVNSIIDGQEIKGTITDNRGVTSQINLKK